MNKVRNLSYYPSNPAYGSGTFRRRIVLTRSGAQITASLLDDFHEMSAAITIADGVVANVTASMVRYPRTTCPGATTALLALNGQPAGCRSDLLRGVDRGSHCTHLLDLAALAVSWTGADGAEQVIEVELPDPDADRRQRLGLTVDGVRVLELDLQHEVIVEPAAHRGRSMFGGFARWVDETFPADVGRLWLVAQMAVFVAMGRAYLIDGPVRRRTAEEPIRKGACFSFSDPAYAVATDNIGYVRDMTAGLPPRRKEPGGRIPGSE